MLNVMRSNRVEALADALAELISRPAASALTPMTVAITSKAWREWVRRAVAQRLGIAANLRLPFMHELVEELLLEQGESDAVLAGGEHYTMSLLAALSSEDAPTSDEVRRRLTAVPTGGPLLAVCRELGTLFESYGAFRTDMVQAWRRGAGDHWQAEIWLDATRRIERRKDGFRHVVCPDSTRSELFSALSAQGAYGKPAEPLYVFVPSIVTSLQLDVLVAVSQSREVNLLLLEASAQYWGDVRSKRDIGAAPRLVVSLGRGERELREAIESKAQYAEPAGDLFGAPESSSILSALQACTVSQEPMGSGRGVGLAPDDYSLEVHSCPGRLREVEIVRELVLEELAQGVAPEDILVLAPDMGLYSPIVEAVFRVAEPGCPQIPVSLGGELLAGSGEVVAAATALLRLSSSRLTAQELIDFVWLKAVRAKFDLSEPDVETIRGFIRSAAIRFGLDAKHRLAHGFGELAENTVLFGLRRLIMGYAVPESSADMVCGTAPAGAVRGDVSVVLGRFAQIVAALETHLPRLAGTHDVETWQRYLLDALAALTAEEPSSVAELRALRQTLERIARVAGEAGLDGPLDAATAHALMIPKLENAAARRDYLRGGVEFASLAAAAGFPARAVFVMGMNDGEIPQPSARSSWDLLAQEPSLPAPSSRLENQRDFLAAFLGARNRFVVTYCGRSLQDGAARPASVLVDELVEAAIEAVSFGQDTAEHRGEVRRRLLVEHPLSRLHPSYFDGDQGSRVFSHSVSAMGCAAAVTRQRPPWRVLDLCEEQPPEAGTAVQSDEEDIDLEELVRFLSRPMESFWNQVLGAGAVSSVETKMEVYEPVGRDPLADYQAREELLQRCLAGGAPQASLELHVARGLLPPGELGRARHDELAILSSHLVQAVRQLNLGDALEEAVAQVRLAQPGRNAFISGVLSGLRQRGRLEVTSSRNPRQLIGAWVRHLVLCACPEFGLPMRSLVVRRAARDDVEVWEMGPMSSEQATTLLTDLALLSKRGQRFPLRLFPSSSFAYAQALFLGASNDAAMAAARAEWDPYQGGPSFDNGQKLLTRRLWGRSDADLLYEQPPGSEPSFVELAVAVWGPLLEHRAVQPETTP